MAGTRQQQTNPMVDQIAAALVEIPVLPTAGYAKRDLEARLSPKSAATLRDIAAALRAEGKALADGRAVDNPAKAVEWIIEQVKA